MVYWPSLRPAWGRASWALMCASRLGSWHSPVTVDQKIRASRMASRSSSSALICRSGAVGKRP